MALLYFSVLWSLRNNNLVEQLRLWWPWQRQCQNITGNIILNKNAYMWSSFRSDFLFCEISNLYLLSQIAHCCSTVPMTNPGGELTWWLWMWYCISQIWPLFIPFSIMVVSMEGKKQSALLADQVQVHGSTWLTPRDHLHIILDVYKIASKIFG